MSTLAPGQPQQQQGTQIESKTLATGRRIEPWAEQYSRRPAQPSGGPGGEAYVEVGQVGQPHAEDQRPAICLIKPELLTQNDGRAEITLAQARDD